MKLATWPRLLSRPWLTNDFVRKLRRKIKIKMIIHLIIVILQEKDQESFPLSQEFKLDQLQVRNQAITAS